MTQSRRSIPWSILCIVLAVTGCAQISKKAGVENRWRESKYRFAGRRDHTATSSNFVLFFISLIAIIEAKR